MTRAELEAALAKCEGHTPGPWEIGPDYRTAVNCGDKHIAMVNFYNSPTTDLRVVGEEHKANACLIALAPALASALREAWAEIDRLKAHLSNPLDEALNSGDGSYKP